MNGSFGVVARTDSITRLAAGRPVVLESQTVGLRLPFGGLLWTRPRSARVTGPAGSMSAPVLDVTRRWQLAVYGFSLLCVAAGFMFGRRPGRS